MPDAVDLQKRAAARVAAEEVRDGMRVGLGTGSTVAHLLPVIAELGVRRARFVATSAATERTARALGLEVEPFTTLDRLDLAIDGADQVAPDLTLIKGGGGAQLREKIVARAADRFVVIADAGKLVERVHGPVPVELMAFGLAATLRELEPLGGAGVREGAPASPDGGVIADLAAGVIADAPALAAALDAIPGVGGHGIFLPGLVSTVYIGRADGTVTTLPGP